MNTPPGHKISLALGVSKFQGSPQDTISALALFIEKSVKNIAKKIILVIIVAI
jgi:hypothetical protein